MHTGILLAIMGGAASTETAGSAQPTPAGIYRSGSNLELTAPGSIICNGLDVVRICESPTQPAFRFLSSVRNPGPARHRTPFHLRACMCARSPASLDGAAFGVGGWVGWVGSGC